MIFSKHQRTACTNLGQDVSCYLSQMLRQV